MSWRTFTAGTIRHAATLARDSGRNLIQWCGDNPDHAELKAHGRERYQFANYLSELARDHADDETVSVSTSNGHNGWTNYETWMVKLWLDNDQTTCNDMRETARTFTLDSGDLAQSIKEYVENLTANDEPASLATDLMLSALGEVNWQEIARHIDEEARDQ